MNRLFKRVPMRKLRRNKFNLSFENKLTTEFGRLTPVFCKRVVPGDTFKISAEMLIRMAPLAAPIMQRANAYVHFFLCYNRNLWAEWKDWIATGEVDEEDLYPRLRVSPPIAKVMCGKSSLADYLGFPPYNEQVDGVSESAPVYDALPFRAYQQIYNEYYRDENYQDEVNIFEDVSGVQVVDNIGDDMNVLLRLRRRNWEKDYFTSALPNPQRGTPTTIALQQDLTISGNGGQVDAVGSPINVVNFKKNNGLQGQEVLVGQTSGGTRNFLTGDESLNDYNGGDVTLGNDFQNQINAAFDVDDVADNLRIDGQQQVTTINELRRAFSIQRLKEAFARFGNRYTEYLRGIYGVTPADKSLGRPEFIGGMKLPLAFGEVLQTSESTNESPLANMAGRGISAGGMKSAQCFCEDHGFIIGILSIMPKPDYMQGMPRQFMLTQPLDFYNPFLANIGEQPIYKGELVYWSDPAVDNQTFGYTPRYAEYKFSNGEIHGDFRESLNDWHMGRIFGYSQAPTLNSDFLEMKSEDVNRVFAVQDADFVDHLWCQMYFDVLAKRPMPNFGIPII